MPGGCAAAPWAWSCVALRLPAAIDDSFGIPCGDVASAWASMWPMAAAIWAQWALAGGRLEGLGEAKPWHLYGGNPLEMGVKTG